METPVVNVNLTKCECAHSVLGGPHADGCSGAPVLVPLPLEPWRSVTMTVVLGTCDCAPRRDLLPGGGVHIDHAPSCASHPIRVTCSIGGKDWASSDVTDAERADGPGQPNFTESEHMAAVRACSARWAVVRAMLTNPGLRITGWTGSVAMYEKRDRMYAAIADMARLEQAAFEAQERATKELGEPTFLPDNFMRAEPEHRASAGLLERYVERLIEQVGVL